MSRIKEHLHLDVMTVTGQTLGENIARAEVYNDDVIRTVDNPIYAEGALAVLKGNLAPDGCVIKPSACEPRFLKHTGPALVFDDYPVDEEGDRRRRSRRHRRITCWCCAMPARRAGPGMPEWGMLPIPKKLVKQGVRDMVRLSDARMSGTSYGACILHVAPEAYIGGPLALVRNGDIDRARRRRAHDQPRCPEAELANAAAPPGRRRSRATSAAMAGCSPGTSSRRTRAATSISWKPDSARRSTSRRSTNRDPDASSAESIDSRRACCPGMTTRTRDP